MTEAAGRVREHLRSWAVSGAGVRMTRLDDMRSGRKLATLLGSWIRIEPPLKGDDCLALSPLQAKQLGLELIRLSELQMGGPSHD